LTLTPSDGPRDERGDLRASIQNLIPEAKTLDEQDFKSLIGLMRRHVLLEHQEEREAQNVFMVQDWEALRSLIAGLPANTRKEMTELIDELALDLEESEIETLNWAFRHQSVGGDLLVGDLLVPFKLVRLKEHAFILLCQKALPEVPAYFSKAFDRLPAVQMPRVMSINHEPWAGYAWFLDPDAHTAQLEAEALRKMWEETKP
jgi:hypothetical protein